MKLSAVVMKNVLDLILTGALTPGDKLSAAADIAKENDVSIICAREALQQLAAIGLLEIRHGRGIFVTEGAAIHEDLLNARKTLEYSNIRLASLNITPEEIELLESLLAGMETDVDRGDIRSFVEHDHLFHLTIARASKNRILARVFESIKDILYYQQSMINAYPGNMENALHHHGLILDALRKHDPDAALYWMTDHLEGAYQVWSEVIAEMLRSDGNGKERYVDIAKDIYQWSLKRR